MRTFFAGIVGHLLVVAVLSTGLLRAEEEAPRLFDVPRLERITLDGKAEDWGGQGFRISVLGNDKGELKPAADFDASVRLGWDERGLLVLVEVTDDVANEAKSNELYEKDSVELFYATGRGAKDLVQMVVSPGIDPQRPELRSRLLDSRTAESLKKAKPAVTGTAVRTKTDKGYILEAALPWDNLGISPDAAGGTELAFQILVNDSDTGGRFQARWYPRGSGHDTMNLQRIRLATQPSPAITLLGGADYERLRRLKIRAAGTTDLAGKSCAVMAGQKELARTSFTNDNGRAAAKFTLPISSDPAGYGPITLVAEGQEPIAIIVADIHEARARVFMDQKLVFKPNVFQGPAFPSCDFVQPSYVEDLIGLYSISATFYDAEYNVVKTAEKPGRYGAVVEIKTEGGRTFRRFQTLYRAAEKKVRWWDNDVRGTVEFGRETGINPIVSAEQKYSTTKYLNTLVNNSLARDSGDSTTPALMCALYETKPGSPDATLFDDFLVRDRQWWIGLKRKLSGADKLYPGPFACPQDTGAKEKPAPVLREGTAQEAGMNPGAVEKIDALLTEWSANSSEAFAVCVARHGVIVLHKAYGKRDGKPMTVDTKSWMASITKAMSGTAMMLLVDQGLVKLDDPVSKFLPSFQMLPAASAPATTATAATPSLLTIRHLYTHTAGLEGHWGDDLSDFDDIVAGYFPWMAVGKKREYNGASLALGSKIVELVSGEALPAFYKRHLLDPLGCRNTDVTNSSYDASSTPLDIARFGQMLLNRGSYGDKRFMRAETFQQMLPQRLTAVLGPETKEEWGIGVTGYKLDGFGKTTFGHGAASSATFRVDPENDLVIVMTRNAAGDNFQKYHSKFLATIAENLAKE